MVTSALLRSVDDVPAPEAHTMLHAHYTASIDTLPTLAVATMGTADAITVSAAAPAAWVESTAEVASVLPQQPAASAAGGVDTLSIAFALIGAWLVLMGGALLARRRT